MTVEQFATFLGTLIAVAVSVWAARRSNSAKDKADTAEIKSGAVEVSFRDAFTDTAIKLQTAEDEIDKLKTSDHAHQLERAKLEASVELLTKLLQSEREARYQDDIRRAKEVEEQKQAMAAMQRQMDELKSELHTVTHANGELSRQIQDCNQRVQVLTDNGRTKDAQIATLQVERDEWKMKAQETK